MTSFSTSRVIRRRIKLYALLACAFDMATPLCGFRTFLST